MAFDETRYETEFLAPLRRRRGALQPTEDLINRYAISPDLTDSARLRDHLKTVRAYWNQKSTGRDNRAQLCRMLIAADEQLRRDIGAKMDDPAFWQETAKNQQNQVRQAVTQLAADLAKAYQNAGRITRTQLDAVVAQFPSLGAAQIADAVKQAKLTVIDDVDLPTASGLDRVSYQTLGQRLAEIGAPTIVQLIHPDVRAGFALIGSFRVAGQPALRLDQAALDAQLKICESAADSNVLRARKTALGLLRTGLAAGADLRVIALYQIVEELCERKARMLPDVLLVRGAVELGLDPAEAELVVASLPAGVEAAPQVSAAERIRELLEAGQLRAAEQVLAASSSAEPGQAEARALVEAAHTKVEQLVRGAVAAIEAQREDDAARMLDEAVRIAADDDDIAARRRGVPPSPPRSLHATEARGQVRLSWSPPVAATDGMRFRIVRNDGRVPSGPQDGTVIATTAEQRGTDTDPPVARQLRYAVYATVDERTWSRPAVVELIVAPSVTDVVMSVAEDRVTGKWSRHRSVSAVRVRRTVGRPPSGPGDGTPVEATTDSFVDRAIREGEDYFYSFVAVYTDDRHREVPAEMVVASATPRAPGAAVEGLTVTPVSVTKAGSRVRISWPTVRNTEVRLRCADRRPAWDVGEAISVAQLDTYGREIPGPQAVDGGDTVVEADVPSGRQVYVAFAIGGTGAIVGRAVTMGVVEPVRQLSAQRQGAQAQLSWVWPDDVGLVELVWTGGDGTVLTRRVTKAEYTASGCVVPVGVTGGTARVSAVAVGSDGETASPPMKVTVAGRPLSVSYRIVRPDGLRNRLSRQRFVELSADGGCAGLDLVVVVAESIAMPLRPDQGTVVNRFEGLELGAGRRERFEVEIPPATRRPYWIRCFATAPANVTLVDPPINDLKVV
jgi:hypothetical protein